jgi:hypothetical protein
MIAKLPGRKNFMGPHLELVCLLQAAEIERLIENLEDYKVKYNPNNLDIAKMKEYLWIDILMKFKLKN